MKIAYHLPDNVLDNSEFAQHGWSNEKIFEKTGIRQRRICGDAEYALDLAVNACEKLFNQFPVDRKKVDYILYCTQSPDFIVPSNSCILQHRLGLENDIGSLDLNQGCTGFIYGLSVAKGLLSSGQANKLLLVTADTWSKYVHEKDKSTRSIFGDGAAATLLTREDSAKISYFVFGTDGSGADNLCVKTSGLRHREMRADAKEIIDNSGNMRTDNNLYMNGPEIFTFTLKAVPKAINDLLQKSGLIMEDIDHFIFHQANGFMLEHLRKKLNIPRQKFHIYLENVGNTVSSTIPIVLSTLQKDETLQSGQRLLLAGFGVGYSWIAATLTI